MCVVHSYPALQGRFYRLDFKNKVGHLGDFHKPWIRQILQFSETTIASCSFSITDNENILQKRREETAEQIEQGLEKQRAGDRKKRERNGTENDREGMLSRKVQ